MKFHSLLEETILYLMESVAVALSPECLCRVSNRSFKSFEVLYFRKIEKWAIEGQNKKKGEKIRKRVKNMVKNRTNSRLFGGFFHQSKGNVYK